MMPTALSPMMPNAEPLPLLLDSLLSAYPAQHVPEELSFAEQSATATTLEASLSWTTQTIPMQYDPQLGSPELPTVGSSGHHFGTCRPCAFLYTKGCSNGVSCSFCHLCDAGEKKR